MRLAMANILKSSGRVAAVTFNSASEVISNMAEVVSVGSELISVQLSNLRDDVVSARQIAEDEEIKELKLRALKAEAMADVLEEVYLQESRLEKIRAKIAASDSKKKNAAK